MNIEKVEIKPNQYVWVDKGTQIKDVRPYVDKWHLEKGYIINKFPTYLTDLSECELIVAVSPELNLEGVPTYVEWLAEQEYPTASFGLSVECERERNALIKGYQTAEKELYTEDDVRKAIELSRETHQVGKPYMERDEYDYTLEQIIEQLKQEKINL